MNWIQYCPLKSNSSYGGRVDFVDGRIVPKIQLHNLWRNESMSSKRLTKVGVGSLIKIRLNNLWWNEGLSSENIDKRSTKGLTCWNRFLDLRFCRNQSFLLRFSRFLCPLMKSLKNERKKWKSKNEFLS